MGYENLIVKGNGVTLPLRGNEGAFEVLTDLMRRGTYPLYSLGSSGAYEITGEPENSVAWLTPTRLLEEVYVNESDGFVWSSFAEELTAEEKETMKAIALEFFDVLEPSFGHFVALAVH